MHPFCRLMFLAPLFLAVAGCNEDASKTQEKQTRTIEKPTPPADYYAKPPKREVPPPMPGQLSVVGSLTFPKIDISSNVYETSKSITVMNNGGTAFDIAGVETSGDSAFVIDQNGCAGAHLDPNGTCEIKVRFAPPNVGTYKGAVVFASPVGIKKTELSGTAFVPKVETKAITPPPPPEPNAYAIWRRQKIEERKKSGPVFEKREKPPITPPVQQWQNSDKDYSPQKTPRVVSGFPVDRTYILTISRPIDLILDNRIKSDLPGVAHFVVDEIVLGTDGKTKILDKGDLVTASFEPLSKIGDRRLNFCVYRIERLSDGAEFYIGDEKEHKCFAHIVDAEGVTGLTGEVDNRNWEKYGSAFLTAGLSAAATYGSSTLSKSESINKSATTLTDQLGEITAQMLQQNIDLAPVVTVEAHERAGLQLDTDLYLKRPVPVH